MTDEKTPTNEQEGTENGQNGENITLKNSIIPSIQETERFIYYLNNRFMLGLKENLIINIEQTTPNRKGYFMPSQHAEHYETTQKEPLNLIVISSLYLKDEPYNTIAHELAHYINTINGHIAKNNYHSQHFKKESEKMLLKVSKGKHGYNITEQTPEFLEMINDFKPNKDAFAVFQNFNDKKKKKGRNLKYMCSCGFIIRSAKNEEHPLKAICKYCNTEFITDEPEEEGEGEGGEDE